MPISGSDFRYATTVYGPDIPTLKGKGKCDRKIVYEDLVPQLTEGELLVGIKCSDAACMLCVIPVKSAVMMSDHNLDLKHFMR